MNLPLILKSFFLPRSKRKQATHSRQQSLSFASHIREYFVFLLFNEYIYFYILNFVTRFLFLLPNFRPKFCFKFLFVFLHIYLNLDLFLIFLYSRARSGTVINTKNRIDETRSNSGRPIFRYLALEPWEKAWFNPTLHKLLLK